MKTIYLFCTLLVVATRVGAADALTEKLQRGLFEEEANHNLDAAIKEYQSVIRQSDEQRKVIATALFRLGECYRKLGRTNDADAQFRRILTDFSEQDALVTLSRKMVPAPAALPRANPADAEMLREVSQRYAQAVVRLSELNDRIRVMDKLSTDELRSTAAQVFKDDVLADLEKRLREMEDRVQTLTTTVKAAESVRDGIVDVAQRPLLDNAKASLDRLHQQIALRLQALLRGQRREAEILEDNVKSLKDMRDKLLANAPALAAEVPRLASDAPAAEPMTQAETEALAKVKTYARNSPDLLRAPASGSDNQLQAAARFGYYSVAEFLLSQGVDPDASLSLFTPLRLAALHGHLRIVRLLVEKGAEVNPKNHSVSSPLMLASGSGFQSIMSYLVEKGADVNYTSSDGSTPLSSAVDGNHASAVEFLLAHGAKPDVLSSVPFVLAFKATPQQIHGGTPLHRAVGGDSPAITLLLLNAGASVAATNVQGYTPLHLAAMLGRTNLCALLLDHGAAIDPIATDGYTPLLDALNNRRVEATAFLVQRGANVNQTIAVDRKPLAAVIFAVNFGTMPLLTALLPGRPDLNVFDYDGETPLIKSILSNQPDMTEALLKAGANPNQTNLNGYLPLFIAANRPSPKLVELLLNYKADPNLADAHGQTALGFAAAKAAKSVPGEPLVSRDGSPPSINNPPAPYIDPQERASYRAITNALLRHGAKEPPPQTNAVPRLPGNLTPQSFQDRLKELQDNQRRASSLFVPGEATPPPIAVPSKP